MSPRATTEKTTEPSNAKTKPKEVTQATDKTASPSPRLPRSKKVVTPAVSSCTGKKNATTNTGPGISVTKNRIASKVVGIITATKLATKVDLFCFAQGLSG